MTFDLGFPGEEPESAGGSQFSVDAVIAILRRRAKAVAIATVIATPPAVAIAILQPPTYETSARVAIEEKPEIFDFGADVVSSLQVRSRNPLARVYAIVRSNRVLGRVVDQLPESPTQPPTLRSRARGWATKIGLTEPIPEATQDARRQRRIENLRGAVSLGDAGGGTILTVTIATGTAGNAAYLANAIADAYVEFVEDRRRSAGRSAVAWLRAKAAELRSHVRRREEAMASLSKKLGGIAPPGADYTANSPTRALEDELRNARLDLLTLEQRIQAMRPALAAHEAVRTQPDLGELRERYNAVRLELATARLKYTPTHPTVVRLKELTAQLSAELGPYLEAVQDPISPEELREARALEGPRASLRARLKVLEAALAGHEKNSGESADAFAEYARLSREVGIDRDMLGVLLERLNQTLIGQATELADARILDYAPLPTSPKSLPRKVKLAGGLAGALAFGFGLGLLLELLDGGIYGHERLGALLGAPFLGCIPLLEEGAGRERHGTPKTATLGGEAFRNLRTRLAFSFRESKCKSLLVTSAVAHEGKSTTTSNLASSFAATGQRVLVIDGDLRRPRIDRIFAIERAPGLSDVLRGDAEASDAIVRPLGVEFDILPAGTLPDDPAELLSGTRFDLMLARIANQYDLVLLDAPVLLAISDALILASKVDGVLLVHKPGAADSSAFSGIAQELRFASAHLVGFVLNQVDARDSHEYPSYLRSPYVRDDKPKTRWQRLRAKWKT